MLLNLSLNFSSKMRQLLILMPTSWRKLTTQSLSLTSTAWSLSREPRATLSAPDYSAPRRGCSVPAAGRMRPPGVSEAPVCRCPHGGAGPPGLTGLPLRPRSRCPRPSLQADGSRLALRRLRAGSRAWDTARPQGAAVFPASRSSRGRSSCEIFVPRGFESRLPASGWLEHHKMGLASRKDIPRSSKKNLYSAKKVTTMASL